MASILSGLFPLFLFVFFLYKWVSSRKPKNLPPSPPKLPIIGNLHQMGKHTHRTLLALSQKYGAPDIMFLQLGTKPSVVISSAKAASYAFKTHDASFSERPQLAIAKLFNYGCKDMIFAPYGDHWRRLKSICTLQLFTSSRVKSFRRVREEELDLMIQAIKENSKQLVNLTSLFSSLTNDIVCRTAFGRKYRVDEQGQGIDFDRLIKGFIDFFGRQNVEDVLPWMSWINRFNGFNAKAREVSEVLDPFVERIVHDHATRMKDRLRSSTIDDDDTTIKDFVDILLESYQTDGGAKYAPDAHLVIKALLVNIFAAGTHTQTITMEWTFTELLRHPKVMKRLQQEIRDVVGEKGAVSEDDLENLTYLKAVIKEIFRVHPPVPVVVPRLCREDIKLSGYDIPAGTQIIFNVWAIGRDSAYWDDVDVFNPERFLNSEIDYKGQHFGLLPFGAGRRGCPGILFATTNIEVVLANLVHQFDWSLPVGVEKESLDMSETSGGIPHKKEPVIVIAVPRA
ncbi:uncharacterized protein [Phyllobates terribilis]|uniref:uncharacterized protein n=1 Tax=Phyllobates terribilis TaxID=111132 RepID=UPI003CCAD590